MNTRPLIESSSSPVALSVSFNQDASHFTIGLEQGFRIFDTESCQLRSNRALNGGIGITEMLGKSNFVGIVGGGKQPMYPQNRVYIWDESKQKTVITIPTLMTTVRGLRLTKTHIVVALLNSVRIYHFAQPPELWGAFETANNPWGLCLLNEKISIFPGRTPGQVQLVELVTGNVSIIPAHSNALRAIAISQDGEVLATASETGTLVRVYTTSSCARIVELRRGVDPAAIYSISLSPSGQQLAVTSDKSTLHIFDVPHPRKSSHGSAAYPRRRVTSSTGSGTSPVHGEFDPSQKWGLLGRIPLLPRVFSDVYSFASARFEIGDEQLPGSLSQMNGDVGARQLKGIIGWTSEYSIVVIGAGKDGRWEKFVVAEDEDGRRYCVRGGWKRYLGIK